MTATDEWWRSDQSRGEEVTDDRHPPIHCRLHAQAVSEIKRLRKEVQRLEQEASRLRNGLASTKAAIEDLGELPVIKSQ